MNKRAFLTFIATSLFVGCSTFTTQEGLDDLRDLTTAGVRYDLIDNPGHRAAYERTITALDGVVNLEKLTPLDLHAALENLPIKQIKSEKAIILITSSQILIRRLTGNRPPVEVPAAVRNTALALRVGISDALKPLL